MNTWWAKLPRPSQLYVDSSGGVIEGYSAEDVRAIVAKLLREALAVPELPMRMTPKQARAIAAVLEHGSPADAAVALGVSASAVEDSLNRVRQRTGLTTLQVCAEFSRRGWEPM